MIFPSQFFVTTWDGSSINSYINGQLDRTASYSNTLDTGTNSLNIGRAANEGFYFDGLIDEASIYNRALSSAEVKAIFDAGTAGKCK